VGSAGWSYWGGSLWPGYAAWSDYFNIVCGIQIDRNYHETVESCGYYWMLDGVCFASERPARIHRDEHGRLHSASGQSIGYPSGWGLWHWHGVQVPQRVIEQPGTLTVSQIESEQNSEVRRAMLERFGQERFLRDSGATPIHGDECGKLYRKEITADESLVMVRVLNPTPEPDGQLSEAEARKEFGDTVVEGNLSVMVRIGFAVRLEQPRFKEYFIRVPPDIKTAREAVAWTFDIPPNKYTPALQT
jgi:hypothetical protein